MSSERRLSAGIACLVALAGTNSAGADGPAAAARRVVESKPDATSWRLTVEADADGIPSLVAQDGSKPKVTVLIAGLAVEGVTPKPGAPPRLYEGEGADICGAASLAVDLGPVDLDGDGSPEWIVSAASSGVGWCGRMLPPMTAAVVYGKGASLAFVKLPAGTTPDAVRVVDGKPTLVVGGATFGQQTTSIRFDHGKLDVTKRVLPALEAARKAKPKKPLGACDAAKVLPKPAGSDPDAPSWCEEHNLGGTPARERIVVHSLTTVGDAMSCTVIGSDGRELYAIHARRCAPSVLPTSTRGFSDLLVFASTPTDDVGVLQWNGSAYEAPRL